MIKFILDCAGSPDNERNDCTVRALAISTNSSYMKAYMILCYAGRKRNRGFYIENFFKNNKCCLGHSFTKLKFRKSITLQRFIKTYPKGTYYVRKRGHVFVVKDGVVFDDSKPGKYTKIIMAWEVKNLRDWSM